MLCNIAYFAVVPKEEFAEASEIAASVFFTKLFGDSKSAANVLNFLVLLSAFGNLLAVLIGSARMLREIGRQGVLPYTNFWFGHVPRCHVQVCHGFWSLCPPPSSFKGWYWSL
ncbi:hypothetical protein LB505_013291 [Fusarium chuoi]|nr:hypothetical protein LB505_013291 [Fusarium chuoi]